MIADVLLDSLLQKQLADTIPEHTEDCLQRFTKDLRQEVSGILALQIAAIEQNRFFDELALAVTSVLPVETFDCRFGVRHEPEREFDFLVCHANFPPILCATPLFSLKQRDYLRFRPQQGCFCPLNIPCPKVPNCPHCGQMCLPRCAHDTLAFSCFAACGSFLRRKPPAGCLLPRLPFPQRSRTEAQRPVFRLPVGTLGWAVKAAQTADTGATVWDGLPVTAASPASAPIPTFSAANRW